MIQKIFFSASLLLALGAATTATAQDKIHLKNGTVLSVKVREVAPRTVTYKKWDNQTGPDYIVNRSEVERITFENGEEEDTDEMDDRSRRGTHKMNWGGSNSGMKYGKNILAFAPIQMTNEGAAGLGLSYERVLDKRSIVSLYIPFAMTLVRNQYNGNYYSNYNNDTHVFFNAYPGLKIYPTGSNGIVRYAVGPSLAIGFGTKYQYQDIFNSQGQYLGTQQVGTDVFRTGIMINNSLNIQPNKNLYLGLELGLGYIYSTNERNYNNYNSVTDVPLVQFNFKIGYRF